MAPPDVPRHPHLAALHAALQREWSAEARAHKAALALPLDEQVAIGVRWPLLRVEAVSETWRGLDVVLRSGVPLHDGIRDGEPILVEAASRALVGRVLRADPTAATVQLQAEADDLQVGATVSVVRRLDPTTVTRLSDALLRADQHDSPLRTHLLAGHFGGVPADVKVRAPLDHAQSRARAAVRAQPPLALIHGPPGTGKTWLLGHLVEEEVSGGARVWALAESNAAVDHFAATVSARGVDVVRLGHPSRVRADLQHLTVDARLARGPLHAAVKALVRDLSRCTGHDRAARSERRQLRRQLKQLRQQAWELAVSTAPVVAVTFGTLARVAERLPAPDVAFVDEATQATEPAVWVPVPHVDRLVLVGDPEQLGPVVKDPGNMLEHSALQRLVDGVAPSDRPPMLEVQYRMSRAVQRLVGPTYGPQYRPSPTVEDARLHHLPNVHETPLTRRAHLWLDTAGSGAEEARDPVSRSLRNAGEARLVGEVVHQLLQAGVQADQVGIATPYSAQVALLRQDPRLTGVEVASINAFQGRERPVMVLSWVRSNPDGDVGFVADNRRLTVAWSRARSLLVQVGDLATLSVLPRFADAPATLGESVVSVWEPPWAEVLGLM